MKAHRFFTRACAQVEVELWHRMRLQLLRENRSFAAWLRDQIIAYLAGKKP